MGQPGYRNIGSDTSLMWQGSPLDVTYSTTGQSSSYYTVVAAYSYYRGNGLSHIYHFAILPDGSTTVIYSERVVAPGGYIVSKLNTDNAELRNGFANIVNQ